MYTKEDFPRNLKEFIGNEEIKVLLDILIKNKLELNRFIPHILFYGRPGLGKTTLSKIIASESKSYLHYFIANQIKEDNISNLILGITSGDILFIDEIHSIDSNIEEILYSVLQDSLFKGPGSIFEYKLPRFTIIGATTEKSGLNKPLIDRFIYQLNLQNYSIEEMNQIANLYSKEFGEKEEKDKIFLEEKAREIIIKISQGVPRLLKNIYLICLDFAINKKVDLISEKIVNKVMFLLHINKEGLDLLQQRYLNYLKEMERPIGLNALSSFLGVTEKDIQILVEPFLLENKFISREPKGRLITERGKKIL